MTKATNKGTCQVCGCLHKLPGDRLSTHGYTVQLGFFSGKCRGSGELPFEQSKDLVEVSIERAQESAGALRRFQDELRQPAAPDTTRVWVEVGCHWYKVDAYAKVHAKGRWVTFHHAPVPGQRDRGEHQRTLRGSSLEEVVAHTNEVRAAAVDKTLDSIARYVNQQRERIKNWKPAPLKPL